MKKSKSRVKDWQAAALISLYRLLSGCSSLCLFRISKVLTFFIKPVPNQISSQARKSIKLCFPGYSQEKQSILVKGAIQHTCCAFFEPSFLWHQSIDRVLHSITKTKVAAEFHLNQGKPRLVIAPHLGSWELFNLWLAEQGDSMSLYKPAKSTRMDDYIIKGRSRNGATLVPTSTAGLRSLLKGLRQGGTCMLLPDQKPKRRMAWQQADFFDHPARTSLLVKRILEKIDCHLFIGAALRDLDSGLYRIRLETLDSAAFLQEDAKSARILNQSIEQFIDEDLEQYQWSYRRFSKHQYDKASNKS